MQWYLDVFIYIPEKFYTREATYREFHHNKMCDLF